MTVSITFQRQFFPTSRRNRWRFRFFAISAFLLRLNTFRILFTLKFASHTNIHAIHRQSYIKRKKNMSYASCVLNRAIVVSLRVCTILSVCACHIFNLVAFQMRFAACRIAHTLSLFLCAIGKGKLPFGSTRAHDSLVAIQTDTKNES